MESSRAADVVSALTIVSYSTGVNRPRHTLPTTAVIGSLNPSDNRDPQLPPGGPDLPAHHVFLQHGENDSIAALSPQEADLPIDPTIR